MNKQKVGVIKVLKSWKKNKAYITTQFPLRCNCPRRLLFKSVISYSLLPLAPQSGCLCVPDDALSCAFIPTPPQSKCWKAELGVALLWTAKYIESSWNGRSPFSRLWVLFSTFEYEKWEEFGSCPGDLHSHSFSPSSKRGLRTSLVIQWLRFCAPNAGCLGSTRGQETRSHMPLLKILHAPRIGDPACLN